MEKSGEAAPVVVEKFKPTQPIVLVLPSKKIEELRDGIDLKSSLSILQVLLAFHLSKTSFDCALTSECTL